MFQYIALLRGINVGGKNKVDMTILKEGVESLGFKKVSTYINSGNIFFETDEKEPMLLETTLEKLIKEQFGLDIKVLIKNSNSIKNICSKIPPKWKNDTEEKTDVMFLLPNYAKKTTLELLEANPKVDTLLYINGTIVWHLNKKHYSKSSMKDLIGTDVYKNMTVRNINTVRKINERLLEMKTDR